MVRKIITVLLCIAVLSAVPISASAAAYDVDISDSTLNVVRGLLVRNYGLRTSYVAYRDPQSSDVILVIGEDLVLSEGIVTFTDCDKYLVQSSSELRLSFDVDGSLDLTDGSCIYSNLGYYPDLISKVDYYSYAIFILLFVALCVYLLRSIFSFTMRSRFYKE